MIQAVIRNATERTRKESLSSSPFLDFPSNEHFVFISREALPTNPIDYLSTD